MLWIKKEKQISWYSIITSQKYIGMVQTYGPVRDKQRSDEWPTACMNSCVTQFSWEQVNVTEWNSCRVKLSLLRSTAWSFSALCWLTGFFTPADTQARVNIYIYVHTYLFCLFLSFFPGKIFFFLFLTCFNWNFCKLSFVHASCFWLMCEETWRG